MSKSTDTTNVPVAPDSTEVVEKQSFFQRKVVAPIKKHPKIAIAITGGVALVTGAAFLGRTTAPSYDFVMVDDQDVEPVSEESDTTVA